MSQQTEKYFENLQVEINKNYSLAKLAKAKGLDPVNSVEVPLARNLAEKVVGLISTVYPQVQNELIVNRILELEKEYGSLDVAVCLKIAEEIAREKFCKFNNQLEAIEAGIRIGFAYITLGVVSSPIEGFTFLKLNKTKDGKDYFAPYFSGPLRSAGGTGATYSLIIIDHLREVFGFAKYDPTENEIKRTVMEIFDFHERVTNLQYLPTEEEAEFLVRHIPIQVSGEPSEKIEASNYKDLPRVDTNFLRSGVCLMLAEGIAQKAPKALRVLKNLRKKGFKLSDWDFLEKYCEIHEKTKSGTKDTTATYMKDLVAGRPIFGHPSRSGAFRFRYGRARVAGFSAVSVHPATMAISDGFLAIGTQLKIEKPTKGCVISVCDEINGPIVKLKDGSVKEINDYDEAKKLYNDVEEIIYFGDILFPFGDVANRNSQLIKPGYVEEWWALELEKININIENPWNISFDQALDYSKVFKIPIHPKYIFFWTQITYVEFLEFLRWMSCARVNGKIILPYGQADKIDFQKGKRALELLGVEHQVTTENVVISKTGSKAIFTNLNLPLEIFDEEDYMIEKEVNKIAEKCVNSDERDVLTLINSFSEFIIKDKAGDFIGTRMGRPEKAKLRKLTGNPHILFPVGEEGGRFRSMQEACQRGFVNAEFPIYYCDNCKEETIYSICERCNEKSILQEVEQKYFNHNGKKVNFSRRKIDVEHYFQSAVKSLGLTNGEVPVLVKGIRGTSSEKHEVENLAKGILRAKFNLAVNKDGTIRYDMTELPITHFKPKEIFVSIKKLKELGYEKDIYGANIENDDQVIELMPHDIIIPCCPESGDEQADDVFINTANFIDMLLEKFYKLPRFYNIKNREDLIGHLAVCMAPHNCAGVIARVIGFSKTQGLLASPYMHAAMRRDCFYPTTKLVYCDKSGIKTDSIGDYVENLIKNGAEKKKIDSFGTEKIEINKEIFAFGVDPKTMKLKKKKIKHFIKGAVPEKWVKIKTALGREQIMTSNHRVCYLDDKNEFKTKKAEEFKAGDKIAILNKFDENKLDKINKFNLINVLIENTPDEDLMKIRVVDEEDFFRKIIRKNGRNNILNILGIKKSRNLFYWYKSVSLRDIKFLVKSKIICIEDIPIRSKIRTIFNNKSWPVIWKIDEDLMRVLGVYSAEGYSRQNKTVSQICYRIMDIEQQKALIKSIKNYFDIKPSLGEDNTKITIANKLVYYLFRDYFKTGREAYSKKVPEIIYNVSDELVKVYLSSYFDGDGTILYQHEDGKNRKVVTFYSVSRSLVDGISLLCTKFGLIGRFLTTKERLPGRKILERYKELKKEAKKHILHHLTYSNNDFFKIVEILNPVCLHKKKLVTKARGNSKEYGSFRYVLFNNKKFILKEKEDILVDCIKEVTFFKENTPSYCFEIEWESEADKNVLWGEQILNFRCDGDEAAMMLLLDVLINFSKKYLPSHRGGTQDAPLVLNGRIVAGEVDDQILDFELVNKYPLELYEKAEQRLHSSEIKVEMVKNRLKEDKDPFVNMGFTHKTSDFNQGVLCSSYKKLPTMKEKVKEEMELVKKIRAVDASDVARLIIERHFIRDIRGNLRKFSQQGFRCVKCNEKFRRPPLQGGCTKCGGKIIFTISEGGIVKYLEPALDLAENYDIPVYVKQNLELTKKYIESIFGRAETKQVSLKQWF
ncbi:MAG: DNA polymerase II large subunit [Nanoarchaeota archaeon]